MNDRDQKDMLSSEPDKQPPKSRPRAGRRLGGGLFALGSSLLLTTGVLLGAARHHSQHAAVMATAKGMRDLVPTVRVAPVEASPATMSVTLPGTTAAFAAAHIYARATGYVSKRNVDIGDHVKRGQLLAELAVPELDQQISQNEATLEQMKAAVEQAQTNSTLAQSTWGRDKPLLRDGWVTGHQGDVDVQTVKGDEAAVSVAQANVAAQERQLKVLYQNRSYALVVAPFDGVITQRDVDVGSLMQATQTPGLSCSRSCRRASSASGFTSCKTRLSVSRRASTPSYARPNFRIASFPAR
jgi:multidrug efflux pump subunit AcrA (membrane-fusion protein)